MKVVEAKLQWESQYLKDSRFLSDVQQPFHLSIYQAQIKYY